MQKIYASKIYSFGVEPYSKTGKLMKAWAPVFKFINEKSEIYIKFTTETSIEEFEKKVYEGEYDLVFANPMHMVKAYNLAKYIPIVKEKNHKIKGIIVTKKGAFTEKGLEALNGKTIAFPSQRSFASSMLIRAELNKKSIDFNAAWTKIHENGYIGVLKGDFDAAGGDYRTLELFRKFLANNKKYQHWIDQLEIQWESVGYTSHAIAYRKGTDIAIINKMKKSLKHSQLLSTWKKLGFKQGMEDANMVDWSDVRKIFESINSNLLNISLREKLNVNILK